MREKATSFFKIAILVGALAAVVVGSLPKGVTASESDPCPKAGCVCVDNGTTKWYESCGDVELE